ncbi:MAG TPA: hypothetical protein H9948_11090 [Candidatus Jeotgalibaca merdavium]|uniref:Uncharacterized protein n=1 Tax=Candidatus Jeotgalibaca merdavium TaxID=2838627 RepID=A0A9D2KZN2_9LACT|nr:hypothetical protein [Candidatus Jeotgalibaca merdavium]
MNRPNVLKEQIQQSEQTAAMANAPETLQEDNAFMNRMKTIPFRNFEEPELKRLWRIALRGVEVRRKIEQQRQMQYERNWSVKRNENLPYGNAGGLQCADD